MVVGCMHLPFWLPLVVEGKTAARSGTTCTYIDTEASVPAQLEHGPNRGRRPACSGSCWRAAAKRENDPPPPRFARCG